MSDEQPKRHGNRPGSHPELRLTEDLIERIADNVRLGMPLRRAAWAEGIPEGFAARWLESGENPLQPGPTRAFFVAVQTARAQGQRALVANLRKAADAGNARAAVFLLRTRHAEDFNEVQHITVGIADDVRRLADGELASRSQDDLLASIRASVARTHAGSAPN